MALTVTRSRVKEKCGISDTTYDTTIDNLILEHVPVLELLISADALADLSSGVQATLNLGATEVVCGELLAQRCREIGIGDSITIGDLRVTPPSLKEAFDLIERGLNRLKLFTVATTVYEADRVSPIELEPEDLP